MPLLSLTASFASLVESADDDETAGSDASAEDDDPIMDVKTAKAAIDSITRPIKTALIKKGDSSKYLTGFLRALLAQL